MIKIPQVSYKLEKRLKNSSFELAHWPNGQLCWSAKNAIGQFMIFNFGKPNGEIPPKIVEKFIYSKRLWK